MLYLNDHLSTFDLEAALPLLSPKRRQQALAFRQLSGRCQSAAAWLLLRHGLKEEYGLLEVPPIAYNGSGKPFFPDHPHIHFNLSHCRAAVICALSTAPVGVDIERIRPFHEELARYTMNEQEMNMIMSSSDPATAFIRLWTMKEAVLKRDGVGIGHDMRSVLHGEEPLGTVVNADCGYVYSVCGWDTDISHCHPCPFP